VKHGLARDIRDVKQGWSTMELIEAHELLDVEADIETFIAQEQERK